MSSTLFDKQVSQESRESLELAEASRQAEWQHPSFVSGLFQGSIDWKLIYPFPQQTDEDKQRRPLLKPTGKIPKGQSQPGGGRPDQRNS